MYEVYNVLRKVQGGWSWLSNLSLVFEYELLE